MKRLCLLAVLLVLFAALCVSGQALADPTIENLTNSGDDITLSLPTGMVASKMDYDAQTGTLTLTIDSKETDWQMVLSSSCSAEGELFVSLRATVVDPVKDIVNPREANGYFDDLSLLPYMGNNAQINGDEMRMTVPVGRYQAENGVFIPMPSEEGWPFMKFVWDRDEEPSLLYGLKVKVVYSSADPLQLNLNKLPASAIQANTTGLANVTSQVTDGLLEYASSEDDRIQNLTTQFYFPVLNDHADYQLFVGGSGPVSVTTDAQGAYYEWVISNDSAGKIYRNGTMHFLVKDSDGKPIEAYSFQYSVEQGTPELWFAGCDDYTAIASADPSRLSLSVLAEDDNGQSIVSPQGIDFSINEGIIWMTMQEDQLIHERDMDFNTARLCATITAPSGAAYYCLEEPGGESFYGEDFYIDPNELLKQPLEGGTLTIEQNYFFQSDYADGSRSIFINAIPDTDGKGGWTPYICWYDSDGSFLSADVILITSESVLLEYKADVQTSVESIPAAESNQPHLVDETGSLSGCVLMAQMSPTGESRYYYELSVCNSRNQWVFLNGEYYLFLPYPPDHRPGMRYTIRHYSPDGKTVKDVYTSGSGIEHTPFGLKIRISSLSPYDVTWEEANDPAEPENVLLSDSQVPKTGDHTPLSVLMACLVLSALIGFVVAQKTKNAGGQPE